MTNINVRLLVPVTVLLMSGCISLKGKEWLTLPDHESINKALGLQEKGEYQGDSSIFSPVNFDLYSTIRSTRAEVAKNRALSIEKSFSTRKLTSLDQIDEDFSSHNLPCAKDSNESKLICDYYVISSKTSRGGGGTRYYGRARHDRYILISLTFRVLNNKVDVTYDDQSCSITFDDNNRLKNYTQLDIERQKKLREDRLSEPDNKFLEYIETLNNKHLPKEAKKNDADIQECLNSDLYGRLQYYFKTHYPKKYARAHLGGAEHE